MATSNEYHFVTRWRLQGDINEVSEILSNASEFARWWSDVYLKVDVLEAGDDRGVGQVVRLHTRGRLPYTLHWQLRVTESRKPYGFSLDAWGDFVGRGVWILEQDDIWVNIAYEWTVQAEKPLLRLLSFLLKPIFSANHRWAMARGEEGLRKELVPRRTAVGACS